MFKNYFKTAWRNVINSRAYSYINIAGLSVGIASSLLIFLWIQNELSVDAFHKNGERLYKVFEREYYKDHVDGNYDMPGLLADVIKKTIPDVEDAIMMSEDNSEVALQAGEKVLKVNGMAAGKGLFTMFSYPLLLGSPASALSSEENMAVSEKTAQNFFGTPENAIGKTVRFNNKRDFIITGVFKNLPQNISRRFDYVVNWDAWVVDHPWMKEWGNSGPQCFVLLSPNANAALVDKKLTHFLDSYNKDQNDAYHIQLGLQKFDEVYLHNHFEEGKVAGGRIEYVYLFSIIAFFILLIACINFMNLTTARAVKRAKEVGVRKAVGADRSSLIRQFISESLLLTAFAVALGLLLMMISLPLFNEVTQSQMQPPFYKLSFWLQILALTLVTGLVSGSYPALYLSSFNPVKVLKGTARLSAGAVWFRKGLVVLQFILSFVLIIGTIIVSRQISFLQAKNIGYDKDNLVYIPLEGELLTKYSIFKTEVEKLPGIQSISRISDNPGNLDQQTNNVDWEARQPGIKISFEHQGVGYDFVRTMKLNLLAGRDFSEKFNTDKDGYILNETAVRDINYKNPIGKFINVNGRKGKIIGVIKDFNFRSLHEQIQPMIIRFGEYDHGSILLRIGSGKTKETLAGIEKLCKELNPAFPVTYFFMDKEYWKLYQAEQIIGKLSSVFAGLAIFISCLGLLGLIMFTAEMRTKEIGIRKVLGASVNSIIQLLAADLFKLIIVAVFIASPIAWWAMNRWLNDYAYKINIGWWMFVLATTLIVLITALTISFHAIKAAIANPVKTLRTE
ncbi:MAG TPA: ABC transporter permease [Niastella sp.]